jgi:hypothetical protein
LFPSVAAPLRQVRVLTLVAAAMSSAVVRLLTHPQGHHPHQMPAISLASLHVGLVSLHRHLCP